jgi:hypothetical protein
MPTLILIDIAIKDAELTGYVSNTLKQFYNLFSWVYIQNTYGTFSKNTKLEVSFPV